MGWIENLLIIAGVSLDIFATMECQGSLVNRINKRQLSLICVLVALWQMVSLFVGCILSQLLYTHNPVSDEALLGEILSIVIFVGLGLRLVIKAVKNERVVEHLEPKLEMRRFVRMSAATCIYTVLTGIACGFLGTNLYAILVMIALFTIAVIVAGMYTGYHFGFEQKTKAYVIGAILLWAAGIDVIVRCIFNLF